VSPVDRADARLWRSGEEDRTNPFGVPQPACVGCGDCCSGCNFGAKNTTLMNYLPDAVNHGAQIFTHAEVSHVERDGERWRVYYAPNGKDAPGEAGSVTADHVILGAGAKRNFMSGAISKLSVILGRMWE
jgi:choline dehydrogenase-like flavoprotein